VSSRDKAIDALRDWHAAHPFKEDVHYAGVIDTVITAAAEEAEARAEEKYGSSIAEAAQACEEIARVVGQLVERVAELESGRADTERPAAPEGEGNALSRLTDGRFSK
jgi:hypothetical protein